MNLSELITHYEQRVKDLTKEISFYFEGYEPTEMRKELKSCEKFLKELKGLEK